MPLTLERRTPQKNTATYYRFGAGSIAWWEIFEDFIDRYLLESGITPILDLRVHDFEEDYGIPEEVDNEPLSADEAMALLGIDPEAMSFEEDPYALGPRVNTQESAVISAPHMFREGERYEISATRYERDAAARKACLAHFGYRCVVCGFDFEAAYGPVAHGYIHVHHLKRLADDGQEHEVDPVKDLRPVCANCHSVIHLHVPPYGIEEMKRMMERKG